MGMLTLDSGNALSVKKAESSIAKNYFAEAEIKLLRLLVEQYLAFAETMAQQRTPMHMVDWIARLDNILQLNRRELLTHAGSISHEMAEAKATAVLEKYRLTQIDIEKAESLIELERDLKELGQR